MFKINDVGKLLEEALDNVTVKDSRNFMAHCQTTIGRDEVFERVVVNL